jgi:hypothetical protein
MNFILEIIKGISNNVVSTAIVTAIFSGGIGAAITGKIK